MKNWILFLVLMVISVPSPAGESEPSVEQMEYCHLMADLAKMVYRRRLDGVPHQEIVDRIEGMDGAISDHYKYMLKKYAKLVYGFPVYSDPQFREVKLIQFEMIQYDLCIGYTGLSG